MTASIDSVKEALFDGIDSDEKPNDVDPLDDESISPLLPRQAWKSQLAYLKAILKAKQALDRSEELDFSEI